MLKFPVRFFFENVTDCLKSKRLIRQWIQQVVEQEGGQGEEVCFIFCQDDFLLSLNQNYLQHDTLTDVITFDYTEKSGSLKLIKGEIYISMNRVRENARLFQVSFQQELRRVMVHGVLHLLGYGDAKPRQKLTMKAKEDFYLSLGPNR